MAVSAQPARDGMLHGDSTRLYRTSIRLRDDERKLRALAATQPLIGWSPRLSELERRPAWPW
jgi:hypothetical protein